jgi:hypothetical protein
MSESGTTPTALVQRMKCAIGGEADIPATQRFFVQGQHAQGNRHLNASTAFPVHMGSLSDPI